MVKKILMILVIVGLGVGLYFGLRLMRSNQDLRRSAAGEKVTLNFTTVGNLDVGSTFKLVVTGSGITEPGFGLIKLRLVFDKDKLSLEKNNEGAYYVSLNSKFGTGLKQIEADNDAGFVDILGTIGQTESQITGVVNPFMTFVFKVKSAGNANVEFVQDSGGSNDYEIFGTDLNNNEFSYAWENASFGIQLAQTTTPVPTDPVASPTDPVTTPTGEVVNGGWGDWSACSKECDGGVQRRNCNSPEPGNGGSLCQRQDGSLGLSETRNCNEQACDDGTSKLSFDFSFAGVRAGSKCVKNETVVVTVLKGDLRKEYKDVSIAATDGKNSRNETVYRVSNLSMADFGDPTGLSVFVKGPKHLQMKFGADGQSDYYNQSGGQLNVESGKVFDFSEYSLLAGDVNKDGMVDGLDFVEIKKRAADFLKIEEGEDNQYDLDGSCMVNTVDMALLVQSLNEKYDQVY